jgi:hypothetical protein
MGPSRKTLDGTTVYLDSYYVGDTYAGVLEGCPPADWAIARAKNRLEELWGQGRPVLVVQPKRKPVVGSDGQQLKTYWFSNEKQPAEAVPQRCHMAWLNSYTSPKDSPDDDGSHLFVIWFDDQDAQDPLLMALKHVEEAGGWWTNAQGWCI